MDFLYLIKCNEFYKIGITNDISDRLFELQVGNPYKLTLVDLYGFPTSRDMEVYFHNKFADLRRLGEWFLLTPNDIRDFQERCVELGGVKIVRKREITDIDRLHASLMKIALGKLIEYGLISRNGTMIEFDMSKWTENLDLRQ